MKACLPKCVGAYFLGPTLPCRGKKRHFNILKRVKDTWDTALSGDLGEDAIKLFEEYVQLGKVKFKRALTPPCFTDGPLALTFSDGSEQAYGAVMYLRWNLDQGPIIRLVESQAKLTPLGQKGDAIKAEMCRAVFTLRLMK